MAETIRAAIRQSLKISVSEGIASNKLVSQIASKLGKPAAFRCVPAGTEVTFLHPLPNHWLPGVGPRTAQRLNAAGLALVRHVAATATDLLHLLVGGMAPSLKAYADGIDERPVVPMSAPAKSYSQQKTFDADITDEDYAEAVLRHAADELMAKVRADGKSIRTLTVKVRYNDMAEDQRSESLLEPTDLETDLYGRIHVLFRQAWKRRVSLRMVSLKLSNVYDGVFRVELSLERSAEQHAARRRLAEAVDELRSTRGQEVILRGHDFRLRERAAGILPAEERGDGPAGETPAARSNARQRTPAWFVTTQRDLTQPESSRISSYIPLRVHSYYSFLDSTLSPTDIVEWAARHDHPAVALTDSGNLHGAVEFVQAAQKAGIRPILGVKLSSGNHPLLLYVESARGYQNLCHLLSRHAANHDGQEDSVAAQQRRPFRREELAGLTEGLIAVSSDTSLAELFCGSFYQLARREDLLADRKLLLDAPRVIGALLLTGVEDHLRVARPPELMPARPQILAQFLEVGDLAVEDNPVTPVGGGHRLMPGRRKIQNGQAAVAEAGGMGRNPFAALRIRATMPDGRHHPPQHFGVPAMNQPG